MTKGELLKALEMNLKKVNPHPTETYHYGFDDGCLVLASGENKKPQIWLSKSMLKWLENNKFSGHKRIGK